MSQIVINLILSIVSSATTRELIEKGLRKLVGLCVTSKVKGIKYDNKSTKKYC